MVIFIGGGGVGCSGCEAVAGAEDEGGASFGGMAGAGFPALGGGCFSSEGVGCGAGGGGGG